MGYILKDRYYFPAIFSYTEEGVIVRYPDLPGCLTSGADTEEALHNAREALEGFIYCMEQDNDPIPEPSDIVSLKTTLKDNQALTLIDVFMPVVREAMSSKSVNKMVSVPQWLVSAGKEASINFSQLMQDALMEKLGVTRKISRRNVRR